MRRRLGSRKSQRSKGDRGKVKLNFFSLLRGLNGFPLPFLLSLFDVYLFPIS